MRVEANQAVSNAKEALIDVVETFNGRALMAFEMLAKPEDVCCFERRAHGPTFWPNSPSLSDSDEEEENDEETHEDG